MKIKSGGQMNYLSYFFISIFFLSRVLSAQVPNAWINEFHYDNVGSDVGEFIEVAIDDTGSYELSNFIHCRFALWLF